MLIMRYDWRNNSVLFVHNFDSEPLEIAFSVGLEGGNAEKRDVVDNLLSEDHSHAEKGGNTGCCSKHMAIAGTGSVGLDYLLKRSDIDKAAK